MAASAPSSAAGPSGSQDTQGGPRLEVDAGYVDGRYIAGRPVPVRVRVEADRLIEGAMLVEVVSTSTVESVTVPVELAGGSTHEYVVVLPTAPSDADLTARATLQGSEARDEMVFSRSTELVGLVPGVANRVPDPVALPVVNAGAVFVQLDGELDVPGALAPVGSIVVGADGLEGLSEAGRRNVLHWLNDGGHLIVDAEPGTAIGGVPEAWQPAGAERLIAGRGVIRYSSGAAAAGRWDEVAVEPTALITQVENVGADGFWDGESLSRSLAADGGFRVPELGWLVVFLVGYIVLMGPVLYLVLRRLGRSTWGWWLLPGVAVGASAVVLVLGQGIRSEREAAHASVVETGPAGAWMYGVVGVASRGSTDVVVRMPVGWSAAPMRESGFEGGFVEECWEEFDGMVVCEDHGVPLFREIDVDMGVDVEEAEAGAAAEEALRAVAADDIGFVRPGSVGGGRGSEPGQVVAGPDATNATLSLKPGDFQLMAGWGLLPESVDGLEVHAAVKEDGSVAGTVTNHADVDLENTLLVAAGRSLWIGDLPAGQSQDWSLAPSSAVNAFRNHPHDRWHELTWSRGPNQSPPVNMVLWQQYTGRLTNFYDGTSVVVTGWADDWVPPIDVGSEFRGGRTAFTTRAGIQVPDGLITVVDGVELDDTQPLRVSVLRGARSTSLPDDLPEDLIDLGGGDREDIGRMSHPMILRAELPPGWDLAGGAELETSRVVRSIELWDGDAWQLLAWGDDGPGNPWEQGDSSWVPLAADADTDGVLYLRLGVFNDWGTLSPSGLLGIREVAGA